MRRAAIPTLIVAAKDSAGNDRLGVTVTIDGMPLEGVDGRPIALDPGEHTFRFEAAPLPPLEKSLVLRTGEKNRVRPSSSGRHRRRSNLRRTPRRLHPRNSRWSRRQRLGRGARNARSPSPAQAWASWGSASGRSSAAMRCRPKTARRATSRRRLPASVRGLLQGHAKRDRVDRVFYRGWGVRGHRRDSLAHGVVGAADPGVTGAAPTRLAVWATASRGGGLVLGGTL